MKENNDVQVTAIVKKKHHPGNKGVEAMNGRTPEQAKDYKREYVETVRNMIAQGFTYRMKLNGLMTMYGVSERMAKEYLKHTRQDIEKRKEEAKEKRRDTQLIQYEYLHRMAVQSGNFKEARECLAEIAKLEGLYAPKQTMNWNKTEVEVNNNIPSNLSPEELKIMESLLNKKPE